VLESDDNADNNTDVEPSVEFEHEMQRCDSIFCFFY